MAEEEHAHDRLLRIQCSMTLFLRPLLQDLPRYLSHNARPVTSEPVKVATTTMVIALQCLDASLQDLVGSLLAQIGDETDTASVPLSLIQGLWRHLLNYLRNFTGALGRRHRDLASP